MPYAFIDCQILDLGPGRRRIFYKLNTIRISRNNSKPILCRVPCELYDSLFWIPIDSLLGYPSLDDNIFTAGQRTDRGFCISIIILTEDNNQSMIADGLLVAFVHQLNLKRPAGGIDVGCWPIWKGHAWRRTCD